MTDTLACALAAIVHELGGEFILSDADMTLAAERTLVYGKVEGGYVFSTKLKVPENAFPAGISIGYRMSSEALTDERFCNALVNDGRHVCRQVKGHDGECTPNMNAESLR